ncbi:hypothetical protein B0H17DRAFT_1077197 [Mycena rosella]|uniref:Uncharacterized protein n=1 Tax=Mycena rosella TaxID=1033263 RepID=A0AAD7D973_MYCRO|nr:hypothetical protein B0H17DRAFT_1077197 [Mycena rosella]
MDVYVGQEVRGWTLCRTFLKANNLLSSARDISRVQVGLMWRRAWLSFLTNRCP